MARRHGARVTVAPQGSDDYVNAASALAARGLHFDLVLVDGRNRVQCAMNAIPFIAPRGWLMLDNSERPRYKTLLRHMRVLGWNAVHAEQHAVHSTFPASRCPDEWRTSWWRRP